MKQKIFIIWASWNVGRELVRQILDCDYENTQIIWVANSSLYIFDENWIKKQVLENIAESRELAIESFQKKSEKIEKLTNLVDLIKDKWLDWEVTFVDVTAWKKELLEMHKYILNNSKNYLVTANKNPISLYSMEEFDSLISDRYDTNTTVMWWWWVVDFVKARVDISDEIKNIEWVFSWTLWYIASELEKNKLSFSEIVRQAKQNGYTEPNPWDDLNWLDVARKVIILARYTGIKVDIKDVEVEPLIDEKYSSFEWEEFLEAIKSEDDRFKNTLQEIQKENKVARYIWEIKNGKIKVWLKYVSKDTDLGSLSWSANLALVQTGILEEPIPHIIKSRWAWFAVTAWSVRVWIKKFK